MTIRLPFPPSVNHYWQNRVVLPAAWRSFLRPVLGVLEKRMAFYFIGKGAWPLVHVSIGKEGKDFQKEVLDRLHREYPSYSPGDGRFKVALKLTMPTKHIRDIDNYVKSVLDALTNAAVWFDDEQVDELLIVRAPAIEKPGWVDVEITRRESPS